MLRRQPVTRDGRPVDRLHESVRVNKPFRPPSFDKALLREQPQRKRKRVSYKDAGGDENDSDDDGARKKKKKGIDGRPPELDLVAHDLKRFPKFEAKPFESLATRRFAIPCMTNMKGEIVPTTLSGISLGIRPQPNLLPRPLHDPMEDHAIVLYDPTIDDRETEEEKQERLKQEEKERLEKEAEEKTKGMFNPHKSLRKLLGEDKKKSLKAQKVAVVLSPKLTKVLRPHQIEGVKVRLIQLLLRTQLTLRQFLYRCSTGMTVENQFGCASWTFCVLAWH